VEQFIRICDDLEYILKSVIFAWNDWNLGHIAEHGVSPEEAEYVIRRASRPYPMALDAEKRVVVGKTSKGRLLHVVFVLKSADDLEAGSISSEAWSEIEEDAMVVQVIFVIHAMPASNKIRRQDRKRRKK
jgi:uncharacterized DUF497 family protein